MSTEKLKLPSYGGQALIEGVLMRGKYALAAAMRSPDGQIIIETEELKGIYQSSLSKIPFLRGLILLWDALGLGTRYLTRSANLQGDEEEKIEGASLYLTLAVSLAIAIGLFFLTPAAIGKAIQNLTGISSLAMNLIEGILRLGGVIVYIWAIGRIPDIQRVFAYHGAEHKTINAFESGADLRPETVKKFPLEHPRCGTSFLLTLMVLSVFIFSVVGNQPFGILLLSRVLLIPVLAMLAYEYIRFTANHLDHPLIRWMIRPNLALQSLTTREPDEAMLEVSIASFNAMLELEMKLKEKIILPKPESLVVFGAGEYQNPPE
ncbi:MAG: DUF1385 domain-containing protein [Chloroflexota bacterium]|nr:MAG: membrane protein [Bellilinea sp.]